MAVDFLMIKTLFPDRKCSPIRNHRKLPWARYDASEMKLITTSERTFQVIKRKVSVLRAPFPAFFELYIHISFANAFPPGFPIVSLSN